MRRAVELARVDFIVVGGVAAVLQGAPITPKTSTSCTPSSLPTKHACSTPLLTATVGKLDCLGTIEEHTTYDILDHIDWMQIDEVRIRVISLLRLIQSKKS